MREGGWRRSGVLITMNREKRCRELDIVTGFPGYLGTESPGILKLRCRRESSQRGKVCWQMNPFIQDEDQK